MEEVMTWLINNIGTIIVAAVVFGIAALIIAKHFKNKKAGKAVCAGGCANCPLNGKCH